MQNPLAFYRAGEMQHDNGKVKVCTSFRQVSARTKT